MRDAVFGPHREQIGNGLQIVGNQREPLIIGVSQYHRVWSANQYSTSPTMNALDPDCSVFPSNGFRDDGRDVLV